MNESSLIYVPGGLAIGGVRIAAHVVVIPSNHGMTRDVPIRQQLLTKWGITMEDDVWIGAGVRILDGVTTGRGSMVGAGDVVIGDTEPYSDCVPAHLMAAAA